ncbi:MAG TPA: fibronectin type III domain-containing protein [Thermodesulfobacteriota bacterium]|nr:fibronectin type III domain-containing protein [Thermodesulfobacteriota bacterium]
MNRFFLLISFVLALPFLASCGKEGEQQLTDKEGTATSPAISTPEPPVGVTAVSGSDSITIRWNLVQGATSYTVYYSEKPGLAKVQGQSITGITATSCEHAKVNKGTMYYYVVTASNGNGESPPSTESGAMLQSLPPATPTGVAATAGDGKITLQWNAVTGAKSYHVYYATATGTARAKGKKVSGINASSYQHTNVKKKTMYYYVVTALNDDGESPASNETGAMP